MAKRTMVLLGVVLSSSGCTCTGPFSPNDAAQICVTLQTCNPREFRSLFGGTLESCTSEPSGFVPRTFASLIPSQSRYAKGPSVGSG